MGGGGTGSGDQALASHCFLYRASNEERDSRRGSSACLHAQVGLVPTPAEASDLGQQLGNSGGGWFGEQDTMGV